MELKKNIALVVTSLHSGGLERNAALLANHFSSKGHNVFIYCLYSTECFFALNDSVKVIDLSTSKGKWISFGKWVRSIRHENKIHKINSIISFGERAGIVTGLAKTKEITHICRGVNTKKKNYLNKLLLAVIKRKINTFVFQTNAQKRSYSKAIQKRGIVINNPFVLQNKNLNKNGISSKRFVMVATFKLNQKRQDIAIKAFAEFHKTHPDYEFDFYGKCNETEKILINNLIEENNLQDYVHLKGETKNVISDIVPSRAFICSSIYEGMPNALIEALSYGIPVISTKWLGYDEVMTDYANALLCDCNSTIGLFEKMCEIADSNDLFESLSEACWMYKLDEFESENIFEKWDNII